MFVPVDGVEAIEAADNYVKIARRLGSGPPAEGGSTEWLRSEPTQASSAIGDRNSQGRLIEVNR